MSTTEPNFDPPAMEDQVVHVKALPDEPESERTPTPAPTPSTEGFRPIDTVGGETPASYEFRKQRWLKERAKPQPPQLPSRQAQKPRTKPTPPPPVDAHEAEVVTPAQPAETTPDEVLDRLLNQPQGWGSSETRLTPTELLVMGIVRTPEDFPEKESGDHENLLVQLLLRPDAPIDPKDYPLIQAAIQRAGFSPARVMDRLKFEQPLEQNPADIDTRLIYADWLEEHGYEQEGQKQRRVGMALEDIRNWMTKELDFWKRRNQGSILNEDDVDISNWSEYELRQLAGRFYDTFVTDEVNNIRTSGLVNRDNLATLNLLRQLPFNQANPSVPDLLYNFLLSYIGRGKDQRKSLPTPQKALSLVDFTTHLKEAGWETTEHHHLTLDDLLTLTQQGHCILCPTHNAPQTIVVDVGLGHVHTADGEMIPVNEWLPSWEYEEGGKKYLHYGLVLINAKLLRTTSKRGATTGPRPVGPPGIPGVGIGFPQVSRVRAPRKPQVRNSYITGQRYGRGPLKSKYCLANGRPAPCKGLKALEPETFEVEQPAPVEVEVQSSPTVQPPQVKPSRLREAKPSQEVEEAPKKQSTPKKTPRYDAAEVEPTEKIVPVHSYEPPDNLTRTRAAFLETGSVLDQETGQPIPVYRWFAENYDGSTIDNGGWTHNRQEAEQGGLDYIHTYTQEEQEKVKKQNTSWFDYKKDSHAKIIQGEVYLALAKDFLEGIGEKQLASQVVSIAGATDDSIVNLNQGEEHPEWLGPDAPSVPVLAVSVRHPLLNSCFRSLGRDPNGDVYLHNEVLRIKDDAPDGFGAAFFARQVDHAFRSGVKYIVTDAAGNPQSPTYNGYYTWPLLGYDKSLAELQRDGPQMEQTVDAARQAFPQAHSVLDILQAKTVPNLNKDDEEYIRYFVAQKDRQRGKQPRDLTNITGAHWWLTYGCFLPHAIFDMVSENTRSMRVLRAYLERKQLGGGQSTGKKAMPTQEEEQKGDELRWNDLDVELLEQLWLELPLEEGAKALHGKVDGEEVIRPNASFRVERPERPTESLMVRTKYNIFGMGVDEEHSKPKPPMESPIAPRGDSLPAYTKEMACPSCGGKTLTDDGHQAWCTNSPCEWGMFLKQKAMLSSINPLLGGALVGSKPIRGQIADQSILGGVLPTTGLGARLLDYSKLKSLREKYRESRQHRNRVEQVDDYFNQKFQGQFERLGKALHDEEIPPPQFTNVNNVPAPITRPPEPPANHLPDAQPTTTAQVPVPPEEVRPRYQRRLGSTQPKAPQAPRSSLSSTSDEIHGAKLISQDRIYHVAEKLVGKLKGSVAYKLRAGVPMSEIVQTLRDHAVSGLWELGGRSRNPTSKVIDQIVNHVLDQMNIDDLLKKYGYEDGVVDDDGVAESVSRYDPYSEKTLSKSYFKECERGGPGSGEYAGRCLPAGQTNQGTTQPKKTPRLPVGRATVTYTSNQLDANRPSRPENRKHIDPPKLAWVDPPKPRGKLGFGPRSAEETGRNVAIGDLGEAITQHLGLRRILPEGLRHNLNVAEEGSSMDREFDHSGIAFEVKLCNIDSTEFRSKPRKSVIEAKLRYCQMHGLKPATLIIIHDAQSKQAWFYWSPGLSTQGVPKTRDRQGNWNFAGSCHYSVNGQLTWSAEKRAKALGMEEDSNVLSTPAPTIRTEQQHTAPAPRPELPIQQPKIAPKRAKPIPPQVSSNPLKSSKTGEEASKEIETNKIISETRKQAITESDSLDLYSNILLWRKLGLDVEQETQKWISAKSKIKGKKGKIGDPNLAADIALYHVGEYDSEKTPRADSLSEEDKAIVDIAVSQALRHLKKLLHHVKTQGDEDLRLDLIVRQWVYNNSVAFGRTPKTWFDIEPSVLRATTQQIIEQLSNEEMALLLTKQQNQNS